MLVAIFKSNHKIISVAVFLVTMLLWIPSFWSEVLMDVSGNSVLTDVQEIGEIKWLNYLVTGLYLSMQAIYLNYIVNKYKLISTSSYVVALLFVLLNSADASFLIFNPIFITNSFILIVLHQLFEIYNKEKVFALSFNTGLLVALATLVYFPAIIVFPLIWFTLIYLKISLWREFIISLFGFMLPLLFYTSYCFFTDQVNHFMNEAIFNNALFLKNGASPHSFSFNVYYYVLALLLLLAGVNFLNYLNKSIVKIKKLMVVVLVMCFLLGFSIFINGRDYYAVYLMMTIPLTIMIANYFTEVKRKWLAEVFFLLLLLAIIFDYFS